MTNMLREGAAWLTKQLLENASDPITYSRGSVSLTLCATIGSTSFDSEQADGTITRFESRDYILQAQEAAKLLETLGLPEDGDLINDGVNTYEALALTGAQPFRHSDRHRTIIRVHTKQIG
jgi:hypothetical protein